MNYRDKLNYDSLPFAGKRSLASQACGLAQVQIWIDLVMARSVGMSCLASEP